MWQYVLWMWCLVILFLMIKHFSSFEDALLVGLAILIGITSEIGGLFEEDK